MMGKEVCLYFLCCKLISVVTYWNIIVLRTLLFWKHIGLHRILKSEVLNKRKICSDSDQWLSSQWGGWMVYREKPTFYWKYNSVSCWKHTRTGLNILVCYHVGLSKRRQREIYIPFLCLILCGVTTMVSCNDNACAACLREICAVWRDQTSLMSFNVLSGVSTAYLLNMLMKFTSKAEISSLLRTHILYLRTAKSLNKTKLMTKKTQTGCLLPCFAFNIRTSRWWWWW